MLYVVGEIVAWLGLAVLLGVGIGWLAFAWRRRPAPVAAPIVRQAAADPEEAEALRQEAERFAAMTAELEGVVGEHNETLTILRSEADAAATLVRERERDLELAEERIGELQARVADVETGDASEAAALRARLDEREAELRDLQTQRAADVEEVEARAHVEEQRRELQAQLVEQRGELERLRAEIEASTPADDARVVELREVAARAEAEVIDLRDSVQQRETELAGVREQLASSVTRIGELEATSPGGGDGDVGGTDDRLRELTGELDERAARLEELERAVAERDEALARWQEASTDQAERVARVEELERAVAERDEALARWQEASTDDTERTAGLERAVAERDEALARWQEASTEQAERTAAVEARLAEREQELAERSEELAQLWGELERATAPDGASSPSAAGTAELDSARAALDEARGALAGREAELDQLRASIADRDAELADLRGRLSVAESAVNGNGSVGRMAADDLREVSGIGPKMAKTLQELGVDSFRELALLTDARIAQLVQKAPAIGSRIERDGWVDQARRLYEAKYGVSVDID